MKILVVNDPFDKKNRIAYVVDFSGGTVAEYKSALNLAGEYVCAVSGKIVDDNYIPCAHDELVFVVKLEDNATSWVGVVAGAVMVGVGIGLQQPWLVGAGASLIAGTAVGLIAQQFTPNVSAGTFENSTTYSWDGIGNIYGEGTPVPVLYGRHRVGGNVIAGFVSGDTTSGLQENKYLHLLFAISEGEVWGLETDSILIDGSPLADYDADASVYYLNGTADQNLSVFDAAFSNVRRRYLFSSKRLSYGSSFPYTLKETSDSALVTIAFSALFSTDSKGNVQSQTVSMQIEYAPVGTSAWVIAGNFDCTASSKSTSEFDYLVKFPSVGDWQLRITRLSEEITSIKASGDSYLKSVEEITDAKVNYKNTALLGIKLKATDKISGAIPEVTSVWRGRKIADVRTMIVSEDAYRNPANVLYDLLTNARYGLGNYVTYDNVDVARLIEFADFCDEIVTYNVVDPESGIETQHTEKRFELDLYLDTAYQSDEIIQKIAQTCRAKVLWDGVKAFTTIDRAAEPVQLFNMGNIVEGSFKQTSGGLYDVPNQIDADFTDSDNEFKRTTVSVVDTDRLDEATNTRSVQLFGLTTQARVHRECLFNLRKLKGTLRTVEFEAEIGAVVCEIGDVILVQHDRPKYGEGGRVELDGNVFLFEKPVSVIAGEEYGLIVRRKNNTFYKKSVTAVASEEIESLTLDDIDFENDDVYAFGIIDKEAKPFIITDIVNGREDFSVKITAAEYNESIYADGGTSITNVKYSLLGLTKIGSVDDDGNVTVVTPQTQIDPATVTIPFVSNLRIEQSGVFATVDGQAVTNIDVLWDAVSVASVQSLISKYELLLSRDLKTWSSVYSTSGLSAPLSNIIIGETYYIAVRVRTVYSKFNDPVNAGQYLTFNVEMPLVGTITGITCGSGLYAINIAVAFAESSVIKECELWMSATNDRAAAQYLDSNTSGKFSVQINEIGAIRYFWARLKDVWGNYNGWYPENDTDGVVGVTSYDAGLLLDYLEDAVGESQLTPTLKESVGRITTIDEVLAAVTSAITGALMFEPGLFEPNSLFVSDAAGVSGLDNRVSKQSFALVTVEQTVTEQQSDINNLKSDITSKATTASVDSVSTRVTTAEQNITAQQTDIDNLKSEIVLKASAANFYSLQTRVMLAEETITVQQTDINNLKSEITTKATTASVDSVSTRMTTAEQNITAQQTDINNLKSDITTKATTASVDSLGTRVTSAEQNITAQQTDINNLKSDITTKATTASVDSLGTRVTSAEQNITAQQTDIDNLSSEISNKVSVAITGMLMFEPGLFEPNSLFVSDAAGVSGLDNRVSNQSFSIAAAEQKITAQQDELGNVKSAIEQRATIESVDELGTQFAGVSSELSVTKKDVGGLKAQLVLKADVNGVVTGMGMYADESSSEIVLTAGVLRFVANSGDEPVDVVIVGAVDGVEQIGINGELIVDGSIVGNAISATSQILLKDGGRVVLGNQNIILDTAGAGSGTITVAKDGGTVGHDYVTMSDGDIRFFYYDTISGVHVPYKSLSRMETGVAYNNSSINISGIWKSQPKIILSPANLQSYDSAYANQNQSFLLEVASITGSNGKYSFTPRAQLVLSAASVTAVYNYAGGNNSDASFATSGVESPANTVAVTVAVKFKSVRGEGTSGIYAYRKVVWRINFWSWQTAWKELSLGATFDYVADAMSVGGLSPNAHGFFIEAYCVDAGGTFSTGGSQYEYWSGVSSYSTDVTVAPGETKQIVLPSLSLPSGYEIYQVDWEVMGSSTAYGGFTLAGVGFSMGYNVFGGGNASGSIMTFSRTEFDVSAAAVNVTGYTGNASVQYQSGTLENLKATVYARKLITNSTTPENASIFESATYSLSAAQVLAEGTINWLAVGE